VKLYTPHVGEITTIHVAIMGMMAQVQLKEIGQKTRRSHLGLAKEGRIPGGKAYGYDVVDGDKAGGGYRHINADEAAVVRRIFTLYADGMSRRAIARLLNEENVPGPRRRKWVDTTIRGQVARGTGILNNANYAGVLEWGRCEFVKDPGTGKRVARINPREKREIVEVPELRIIDDVLWNRVKVRQEAVATEIGRDEQGNALNRVHRRRFLLSGVLVCGVCGVCGGRYTIMGKDRYGCAGHRNSGTCPNDRTISRQTIENRVLAGLKERLTRRRGGRRLYRGNGRGATAGSGRGPEPARRPGARPRGHRPEDRVDPGGGGERDVQPVNEGTAVRPYLSGEGRLEGVTVRCLVWGVLANHLLRAHL